MKNILLIMFFAFTINASAQITLEHKYDTASDYKDNILMIVKFELLGECYVKINREGNNISIYDLNHSLIKTISFASYPPHVGNFIVLYLSQQLFDTDSAIEFLYGYSSADGVVHTRIYKEDGTSIFIADSLFSWDEVSIPQQQVTIYNTPQGTKMILSHMGNDQAYVYSLPGTLSTGIQEGNAALMQAQGLGSLYPNPSTGKATLQYELPKGETQGEIILYNTHGAEVKRYKVDDTFKDLLLDNTQLPAGTYFYQLQTSKGSVGTKKMVVVK
ncbi:MAG: T9SS type A sorting domain-containing protein [Bacteroidetes bacterium]|nr:T9SS type A sorting domain-containing protein [Bacteroidota bacterium]